MSPGRESSLLAAGLTLVTGLAVCAIAAAVMVPALLGRVGVWPVLAAGFLALAVALGSLWRLQARRDHTLR